MIAGADTPFHFGASLTGELANFDAEFPYGKVSREKGLGRTQPVGRYRPNAWGLFDMHGNIGEWCRDTYGPYPGDDRGVVEPTEERVVRGGSWFVPPALCRSAARFHYDPAACNSAVMPPLLDTGGLISSGLKLFAALASSGLPPRPPRPPAGAASGGGILPDAKSSP